MPPGIPGSGWCYRSHHLALCRSCNIRISNHPSDNCQSEKHKEYYFNVVKPYMNAYMKGPGKIYVYRYKAKIGEPWAIRKLEQLEIQKQ